MDRLAMSFPAHDVDRSQPSTVSTSLLAGAQRMDANSWSRLVTAFGPIVYGWCRASGIGETDAPDIVQEVFTAVARGIGTFERRKESGSFRSWLATITRSRVRDHLRRRARQVNATGGTDAWRSLQQQIDPQIDNELEASLDSSISVATADRSLPQQILESVAAEFDSKTWNAFWRTTVEMQPVADVAQETGLTAASIYQARSRVLRRLRQRLAELP